MPVVFCMGESIRMGGSTRGDLTGRLGLDGMHAQRTIDAAAAGAGLFKGGGKCVELVGVPRDQVDLSYVQ